MDNLDPISDLPAVNPNPYRGNAPRTPALTEAHKTLLELLPHVKARLEKIKQASDATRPDQFPGYCRWVALVGNDGVALIDVMDDLARDPGVSHRDRIRAAEMVFEGAKLDKPLVQVNNQFNVDKSVDPATMSIDQSIQIVQAKLSGSSK